MKYITHLSPGKGGQLLNSQGSVTFPSECEHVCAGEIQGLVVRNALTWEHKTIYQLIWLTRQRALGQPQPNTGPAESGQASHGLHS